MRAKSIVLLLVALIAGLAAFVLARGLPTRVGTDDPDYYCYVLHRSWTCAYARADCEARLARERPEDVEKQCLPHSAYVVAP